MTIAAVFALLALGVAHATTQVTVTATAPAGAVVKLAPNENFYLRLHYRSDVPTYLWARPYFHGAAVKAGSNPSRLYPAGEGDALGWFFVYDAGAGVDEVRLSGGRGTAGGSPVLASYRLDLSADAAAAKQPAPEWVQQLLAQDEVVNRADREKALNTPATPGEYAWMNAFMFSMLAFAVLGFAGPAWGLWRWRGYWRLVAAIPGAWMAFVVARLFIDTARDPTSHNLWPFEIVIWAGLSCGWMILAVLAHALTKIRKA